MGQDRSEDRDALLTQLLSQEYGLDAVSTGAVIDFARAGLAADGARAALAGEPAQVLSIREMLELGRLEGEIEGRILREPMVEAADAGVLAGSRSAKNTRQYAHKLRKAGELIGLPRRGGALFPAFQFDAAACELHEVVRDVNVQLCADRDPWGAASWWFTPHEVLGGDRPADRVGSKEGEKGIRVALRADLAPIG